MEVSFLYADGDGVKIYQFKSKDSKIKEYIHCAWEIIQSDCLKKTELNRYIYVFLLIIMLLTLAIFEIYILNEKTLHHIKCLDLLKDPCRIIEWLLNRKIS